jgi:diacylglycerol O-acyltransferase / wax synthase
VTSYNGMVYFGINADRDAMSDVDMLPGLLSQSLEELLEAARSESGGKSWGQK